MIFIKDVDGLYTADPKTDSEAEFIAKISVADLLALNLPTLPFDPIVLDLMTRARLAKRVQIINGLMPGNLTRALNGEDVGTIIHC
jgi:molybdenum storage protein